MLDTFRAALRSLTRSRGVSALLLLSLALGTGANVAVCGIVYALLLRGPAGVEHAERLTSIYTSEFSGAPYGRTSYPDYQAIAALPGIGDAAASDDTSFANVRFGDAFRRVRVIHASDNYFSLLGMDAHAGEFSRAGAVISLSLAEHFGGSDRVVGQQITIGEDTHTVSGVAPRHFRGLQAQRPADVWLPFPSDFPRDRRGDRSLAVIARPTTATDILNQQLQALAADLASRSPETNRGSLADAAAPRTFTAAPYSHHDADAGSGFRVIAAVIIGAVVLLLVSACVNAGTLLLSRALARRHEIAVKLALGATRRQLIAQLFAESLLVSVAGGCLGLLLAWWITTAVPALFSPDHAEMLDTSINPLLVALTVGVSAAAGAVFGIAPAIHGTGAPATLALRGDAGAIGGHSAGSRMRAILITAQLALSSLLLIATTLLENSLAHALRAEAASGTGNVALLSMMNPGGNCTLYDPVRGVRFQQALVQRLPRTTGVEAVGWALTPPLGRLNTRIYMVEAGAKMHDRVEIDVNIVTPGYFETLRIPLVNGRYFDSNDGALARPVAMVDELLAQRHFGAAAVGQHLISPDGERITIIGVVRSARFRTLQDSPQPTVYRPLAQEHRPCGFLFVRTGADPAAMLPLIQGPLEAIDGGVTITKRATFTEHLSEAVVLDRLVTRIVGLCGLIALVMGAAGVYGAMNDAVRRRTREIGLRAALGAGRFQVARLVMAEGVYLTSLGVGLGMVSALALERLAASFAHGLPSLDLVTLTRTPAMLAAVLAVAAIVPLRRALSVNPTVALRAE